MIHSTSHSALRTDHSAWPRWPLVTFFVVLFFGPIIAPLFQATRLWLVADAGALARDLLSLYVCPTPAKSYELLGYPMAVCARCWGATIGVWAGWAAIYRLGNTGGLWRTMRELFLALVWPLRLMLVALPFLLWVAEIRWWPGAPLWALLINGAIAGFGAGLFFCSIWPGYLSGQNALRR